jgi:hypothetical protein
MKQLEVLEDSDIQAYNDIINSYTIVSTVKDLVNGIIIAEQKGIYYLFLKKSNRYYNTYKQTRNIHDIYNFIKNEKLL